MARAPGREKHREVSSQLIAEVVILAPMESPLPPEPRPLEPRPAELGFPLNRDNLTLTDLLSRASEAWSRDLATWVLAMLLYWLLGFGVPFALGIMWGFFGTLREATAEPSTASTVVSVVGQVALQVAQLVLSAVFILGLWAMAVRGLHGQRTTVGVLFSQLSKVWKYILQAFVVAVGAMLTVIPVLVIVFLMFVGPVDLDTPVTEFLDDAGPALGVAALVLLPLYVYLATGLAFMQAELAFNDDAGPIAAIIYSWRIARKRRWRIIGIGLIAGLIWIGSAMLCGIGLLFGAPFSLLLLGALYLALRNGADVPPANTATTLGRPL